MISESVIVGIIVLALIILALGKIYFMGRKCKLTQDLTGKVILITGGDKGVGQAAALSLAQMNATIIIACRNPGEAELAVQYIISRSNNYNVQYMRLDLSDLASIKEFAEKFKAVYSRLDILINNETAFLRYGKRMTVNHFEEQFGVNHLGHFYLTNLLTDVLRNTVFSRVINVSSVSHHFARMDWKHLGVEQSFWTWKGYWQSKLANILFTNELQRRFEGDRIKTVALHPGVVKLELWRNQYTTWYGRHILLLFAPGHWYFMKTPQEGAQTILECALMEYDYLEAGGYYADCRPSVPSKAARNEEDARKLWEESEKMVYGSEYQHPTLYPELFV